MQARTAVIPAAGLGTRFRPVTTVVPKELLPIVDTPALQFVLDEARGAGIEHVVVVSNPAKPAIAAYCDTVTDLRITVVHQHQPLGLGHAVGCAAAAVGDEPVAVLLPDELMGDSVLLQRMIHTCADTGGGVVGVMPVPLSDVSAYGVVRPSGPVVDDVVPVSGMVEKPAPADAPSDLIIIGRYVLTPDVFAVLADLPPAASGEIQLTDALAVQAGRGPFHGVINRSERHDTGTPLGWLTAVVDAAERHPVVGREFHAWLTTRSSTSSSAD